MKKDKSKRTTMYIDADVYMQFKIIAVTLNKSVSELVEEFMKQEIDKQESEE